MTVDIDRPRGRADALCSDLSVEVDSLVALLRLRAEERGEQVAYTFLADGEEEAERLTFAELDRRAREIGAALQGAVDGSIEGRPVLLLYPPGLEFVAGFFGCLYAGAVAVPAYPPRSRRSLPRLRSMAKDAEPAVALTTSELVSRLEALAAGVPELADLPALATDALEPDLELGLEGRLEAGWRDPRVGPETLAFLQYTSGSTAAPKGVMVSHGNLLHNEEAIRRGFGQSEASVIVGWLPLYHDMGLIGNVLQPLYLGARCVLMSPVAFLQKPVRWLRAISRYRATTSGGPSFSYDLVARKSRPEDLAGVDLSSWTVAFNGAEPVRAATLDRFAEAFAPYGFRREAFYPCYGLAEATLFVTGGAPGELPVVAGFHREALERGAALELGAAREAADDAVEERRLVSSGRAQGGQDVRVVDPETRRPVGDGAVGEIWVRGPNVTGGYWRRPEATAEDFGAELAGAAEGESGPYLRTGDLGFLSGGELFVTGRRKDLIILRGRNLYPQDLELTAERAHPALRPGCGAAFSLERAGQERLAIVHEVHRHEHDGDHGAMADAIRAAVAEEHDAPVDTVVLIRHGTILKTSSGKIRRSACREAMMAGELAELARSAGAAEAAEAGGDAEASEEVGLPSRDDLLLVAPGERRALLAAALQGQLARALGVDRSRIDPREPVLLDSLAALELKSRLDAALRLDLPLDGLIDGPTLDGLTESLLDAVAAPEGEEGAAAPLPPVQAHAERPARGPLSYGQRALWLEHRLAPESPAYTIVLAARLRSDGPAVDAEATRCAFEALVERHPVLGARIDDRGGGGPALVYRPAGPALDWEELDAAGWSEQALRERLDEEAHRPFDLAADAPLRARLHRRGPDEPPVLLLAIHHAAVDLRSLVVVLEELGALYAAFASGQPARLPEPAVSHADYVAWQEGVVSGARGEALWKWWRERLAGFPRTLDLPADRPRPASRRMAGGAVPFDLSADARAALAALAREDCATLYMVLLAAFAALLSRHAGQEELIVGSPAAGRPRPELRDLVGYLVNPLPLPVDASGDPGFRELLGRVRESVLGALAHESYPSMRLAERAAREGDGASGEDHGLFRTLFVLERPVRTLDPPYPAESPDDGASTEAGEEVAPFVLGREGGRLRLGGHSGGPALELESVPVVLRGAQLDLALTVVDGGPDRPLTGELRYDGDLFDRSTAARLARRLATLVTGALGDPATALSRLPLLAAAEAHQLRHEWNDTRVAYPEGARLDELIARQTEATPDRIALVSGHDHLTYAGLGRRVAAVAARLRALGVGPEVRVGVCAERSAELVIGLRATIEAGGAYVPLDPDYPADRLAYMVEDAAAPVLLTTRELLDRLPVLSESGAEVVLLDAPDEPAARGGADRPSGAAALAYTIYTSGSTGKPKGAMNAHSGIVNRLLWMRDAYGIGDGDRVLQKTPFSFDVSVWELFLPSLAGATLVMARPGGHQEPVYLVETIEREAITTIHFVPSMLQVFLQAVESGVGECPGLRRVIASGEALPADLRERFRAHLGAELHNLYGPTEAAVDVTAWATADDPPGAAVPIGRPVANTAIRVLDRHLRPAPIGVPGELHIGGVQVGRGYLGRPALTASKYLPDPYAPGPGARTYATGDLARTRPDGAVDFLGRIDHQVKVRGFRIELGEIEAALESHPGVREAVVTAWAEGPGGAQLVAYLVSAGAEAPAAEALREHLGESLPEYMVPAAFSVLDAFPLTPSGKVNRRALPDPEWGDGGPRAEPPRPGTEQRLAALWREVLGRDEVGRDDHFFRLGGHSLLAAQLATRIGTEFGVDLPLRVAFERPTVAALAAWIDGKTGGGGEAAGDGADELDWWRERLAGVPGGMGLPTDRPRFAAGGVRPFPLDAGRIEALLGASGDAATTLPAVLLAGWAALLARYTGEDDLVIGIAEHRSFEGDGGPPGLFPVRLDLSDRPSFTELAARATRELAAALAHGPVPPDRLVRLARALGVDGGRPGAVAPLFQTGFAVENADPRARLAPGALRQSGGLPGQALDLALWAARSPAGGLEARVEYDRDLFDDATVRRMIGHLQNLLAAAGRAPDADVWSLPLMDEEERRAAVVRAADAAAGGAPLSLHGRVAARAAAAPDAIAVSAGGRQLSYGELDRRAERLARRLRPAGVGPERIVAIDLPRSPELAITCLGVLCAGAAYRLVAPDGPPPSDGERVLRARDLEDDRPDRVGEPGAPPPQDDPARLAACLATGSGEHALLTHGDLLRLLAASGRWTEPGGDDAWWLASTGGTGFLEPWGPLVEGGRWVVAPDGSSAEARRRWLAAERVTVLTDSLSSFRDLDRHEAPGSGADTIRLVLLGGEAAELDDAFPWLHRRRADRPCLVALPTGPGAAVPTTYRALSPADLDEPWRRPIGRPLPTLSAVVTDPRGEPVPVGVPGELRVGGDTAGRGYLGRPGLTAERLVPDPFSGGRLGEGEGGARLFRTGALVRRRADGDLEHLGRIDQPAEARSFGLQYVEVETFRAALGTGVGATADAAQTARERPPRRRRPVVPEGDQVPPAGAIEGGLADIWCEVLGLDVIGATDDFFRSGGHSLAGAQAMLRTRKHFGVDLPVRALFDAPTVRELGAVIAERLAEEAVAAGAGAERGARREPLVPVPRPGPDEPGLPLSYAQERLWFLEQMNPGRPVYAMAGAARVEGGLDPARLAAAIAGVVERHEAVRTVFPIRGARPVQEIVPPFAPALPVVDLSALPDDRREALADRLASDEARRPFDLAAGPLLRTALLRLEPASHVLLVTFHHIVSDGWSVGVFLREMAAFYAGEEGALDRLPVQYADYSVWQRRQLSGEGLERDLDWWAEHLAGAPAVLELPADRPRPPQPTQRGVIVPLPQDGATAAGRARALAAAARDLEATPFMVLMAALDAFLYRYTGQDDLVVGTPVANRDRIEVEGLIGFFVNTLVLRTGAGGDPSFAELVGRVRDAALDAFGHQDVPFAKLVEALRPERDASYTPIFQVMLVADRGWIRDDLPGLPGQSLEPFLPDVGVAKFDLTFQVQEGDDALRLALEASLDLFDRSTAERMLGHFATLLDGALADPGRPLSALALLPDAERRQLLVEWNDTAADPLAYPAGGLPLHRAVEHWAEETPDAVAVGRGGAAWTYGELWRRAGRLARRLRALGVGPDVLVGLSVGRDPELVLGVVATLRAGGAWLPLDPSYPAERLRYMVEDARPRVLLARSDLAAAEGAGSVWELAAAAGAEVVLLHRPEGEPEGEEAGSFAEPAAPAPESLAYVIYTSGSTGRPKGVALSHRGLVNLCAAQAESFAPGPGDRVVQFAPASFDASVFELAMALRAGAEIRLADPDELLPGEPLHRLLGDLRVTNATLPPSALGALPPGAGEGGDLPALRTVIVAGEACPPELARRWGGGGRNFWNAYGPTETTVWATAERYADPDRPVTIGRPVVNARVHLLDRDGTAVPPGVPGELLVGGPGLARGYLGRPALTAERFVPNRFSAGLGGGRLYRTGDVARRLPDGRIDFVGRIDHQVKVRGFRIELGEIEAVLSGHPAVAEAVVVARDDGPAAESRAARLRLVGYVVPRDGAASEPPSELTAHLRDRLPAYMVPSALVVLGAVPRTPAGKVDRAALPAPEAGTAATAAADDPPRGETEVRIADLWAELLEIEPAAVSRSASFFDLGGHSLLATRATARLREALGVEVPVRRLFERPTVAGLAEEVDALRGGGEEGAPRLPPLVPVERDGPPPLSFAQERLWFLDRLQPGHTTYNIPVAVRLVGELDLAAFRGALGDLVARHESLRTTFASAPEGPVQEIAAPAPVPLPVVDLSGVDPRGGGARREAEALRLARQEAATPFDLEAGPLVRAAVARLGAVGTARARRSEHLLLLDMHHAISDGWSVGVLLRELGACYEARRRGKPPSLPSLPIQYADYAVWQRGWLAGDVLAAQIAHWREALAGLPDLLELPTDRPRPPVQRFEGGAVPVDLGPGLSATLDRFARERDATPFMVLLAAFHALLGRYAGQDDLAIGSPVANRTHAATEGLIGFFVNTLVLRGDLSGDPPFGVLVERARETALAAYAHQDLPFEKLVEELRPGRSLGHSPLFQVLLVLQNVPLGPLELPGLTLEPLDDARPAAKFDLTLTLREGAGGAADGLAGTLEYRRDLFDRETAARMTEHLRILLEGALEEPEARLSELPWLTEAERRQLRKWNRTEVEYPRGATLAEAIAVRVEATPERVAVVSGDRHLSFGALAAASRALAARLRALGVGPEVRVGVCAERSVELPVALVAVLEAGGAYVPFDPSYPPERLAFMLADSGARVLLAEEAVFAAVPELAAAVEERGVEVILLEGAAVGGARRPAGPAPAIPPSALAYAIYTSGSTGRPKGAMNAHEGVLNRLLWMRDEYRIGEGDRILQKTPFSFDVSVWELFLPLLAGARLVMARPEGHKDPAYLVETIRREGVTTLHFVPSMLQAFAEAPGVEGCRSVRRVIASGEALPGDLRDRLRERLDGARLHNLYGPTEAAIDVTAWPTADDPAGAAVPIGRPVANTAIHVADPGLRPVPPGVPGELLIGGVQVGRGYLGRPALTAERFVPDPFPLLTPRSPSAGPSQHVGGGRVYRTGDLARFRRDGAVEYLGRLDHQVKVRGFRIELGEIEAALEAHPGVREAVVVAADGPRGDTRLAAYLVASAADEEPAPDDLRAHIARTLPEYMVPAAFVTLPELPLTPSGKADRRALPTPDWGGGAEAAYAAPRTPAEELVADVWARVLGVERVGVHDDFFALGGHSLLAARLMGRLQEATGVELPLLRLFETPTVSGLARALERRLGGEEEGSAGDAPAAIRPLPAARRAEGLPLSPAQERLWFLDRLAPGSPWYNIPAALRLDGALDTPALAASLAQIVRRHEALRTTLEEAGDAPVQVVHDPPATALALVDLSALPEPRREAEARRLAGAEARRPFDLARGPLFRRTLLRLGGERHVLLVTFHHTVADGGSLAIFLHELAALYGERAELPALPVQYGDYAAWQRERLAGGVLARQLGWWRDRLVGVPPVLDLATDRPRPPVQGLRGGQAHFRIGPEAAAGLRRLGRERGATLFMVLLAAFDAWLLRHGAGPDLVVGSPVSGRDRSETESLIGLFVNLLPLRLTAPGDAAVSDLLAAARDAVLGAHAHREVPFERLVEELKLARDPSRPPLVQAALLLDQETPPPALPGLAVEALELDSGTAKFDLALSLRQVPAGDADEGELAGVLEYDRDLFDATTAARLAGRFARLAAGFAACAGSPERAEAIRLAELPLLAAAERHQLTVEWNATETDSPRERLLHELVREQAERRPERVALVGGAEHVTYGELMRRADRLAVRLRELGVAPETRVGLALDRSPLLVEAVLGILVAGGAYVPLDASYPTERLRYLVEDSDLEVLVTSEPLLAALPVDDLAERGAVVLLDGARRGGEGPDEVLPDAGASSDRAAYVMYTSGSTGKPKGVVIPHRGVVRLVHEPDYLRLAGSREEGSDETGLLLATLSFDATTFEIWFPLLAGGRLAVVARQKPSLAEIVAEVGRQRVTTLFATAALYHQLVDEHLGDLAGLRNLISGGEALSPSHVRRTVEELPGAVMVDAYGPTENSAYTSAFPVNRGLTPPDAFPDPVPIGRPIGDTTVHVVDPTLRPVAVGVPGELVTGGDGVARGYAGRPGLTAERFVADPFAHLADPPRPGARLYRTGDLARWLPSGDVEFLGRLDHQVKIRGFRVEPGEIEAALAEIDGVGAAVVLIHDDLPGGKAAVGYVVPEAGGAEPEPAALREALRDRLPEFMCPSFFVPVDELPLNVNGKVDRRALAALGSERIAERLAGEGAAADVKVPPRTPVERELAAIWEGVLGVSGLGVEDDFFELGGHSLLATRLASRIRTAFGVELPLRALFERPTVAALAQRIAEAGAGTAEAPPLEPLPPERRAAGDLPLSFAQQRLWFLDRLEPGSALYAVPAAFRAAGPLRPVRLARALDAVVARHEALRTTFPESAARGGEPVQRIAPPPPEGPSVPLPAVDLSALPESRRARAARTLAEAEARRPFDLAAGPLLRALLVRSAPDDHLFLVNQHHIVSDGWSLGVFVGELAAAYGGEGTEAPIEALPPLPVQYADYAAWQRDWLTGEALERRLAFWRGHLAGVPPIELPTDRPRPPLQTFRGAARGTTLPPELAAAVRALAREHGATLFMVLLAGFEALLGRTAGADDFAVGTPVAGRDRPELEGLIGFFVDTLALRADLSGEPSFADLVARVRAGALDAFAHQELPFERVVDEMVPERDLARPPIFQVAFALQEAPPAPSLTGLALEPVELGRDLARFELGMTAFDRGSDGIEVSLGFNTDLFDGTRIERMLGQLRHLLAAAVADPERPVRTLPLLGRAERHQLLAEWNDPAAGLPLDWRTTGPSPGELFAAAAEQAPDAVALADESGALTYRALDRRAESLALELRAAGVGPEVVVGVSIERSFDLVTGLLAVLRAGGAYLPLDPSYPSDRLRFMAEDSGMRVLLTDERSATELPVAGNGVARLVLERLSRVSAGDDSRHDTFRDPGPDGAAYVIYTSGSTGKPKGVVGTRRAMGNLLRDRRVATVGPSDRVLHKTPVSFDASIFEIFSPLVAGATAVLARPGGEKDAAYLVRRIAEERVTVAGSTPSMLATLLDQLDREGADGCRSLRRMATGSEAVPPELAHRYHALGLSDLFNLYGPTETTVAVLEWASRQRLHDRAGEGDDPLTLPIGRPMAGARIYLLDAAGEPAPPGVPGEIAIGGPSLARGYLGRPAATAERYRPALAFGEPMTGGEGGARIYRTGDLARQRPDGAVEFLGRIDRQVKVRGFRIELAEVERALTGLPGVREAAAVTQEMGGEATRRLVAYLVPEGGGALDTAALRDLLAERVPEFMVPSALVVLDALPLTPSEKVDRRALEARAAEEAAAALAGASGTAEHVPPRDDLERELCVIWQDLLGVERVGVTDDFFRLGGHSLLAVRLVSRVSEATGRELPLAALFQAPTVEKLARVVRGGAEERPAVLVPLHEPARGSGEPPLFLVHAVGGSAFAYRPLAEALAAAGPAPPVYGLQAPGLLPGRASHETVEEMAAAYLEEVVEARPHGPYRLGGWSFGALVACEMARRLEARGEAVELLALIDPTAPGAGPPGEVSDLAFLRLFVRDLSSLSESTSTRPLDLLERELRGEVEEALAEGGWEAGLERTLARAAEAGALPADESAESLRWIAAVYRANAVAAARYRPAAGAGPDPASVVALCAAESPASDGLARWREVLGGDFERRSLPGDHYSLLRPPRVAALASALAERRRERSEPAAE